jgi:hypothetical protein
MDKYHKAFTRTSIGLIVVGFILMYFSNNYSVDLQQLRIVESTTGKITYEPDYKINFDGYVYSAIGQTLISFGVSIVFVIYIGEILTKRERKDFEKKLSDFQKSTAEGAILSVFDTIIEKSFYDIIRRDVIGIKLIRKNVTWSYIIEDNNGKASLKRIINYELHNLTSTIQEDPVRVSIGSNRHSKTLQALVEIGQGDKKQKLELKESSEVDGFKLLEGKVAVDPNGHLIVTIEFEQQFNSDYIYECHMTNHPLTDLTLNVNKPKNYSFSLSQQLSSRLELFTDKENLLTYKSKGAIYKGQSIEFYSEKRA